MKHLIDATRQAIADENWYAALSMALTLPDICGALAHGRASQAHFVAWWDSVMTNYAIFGPDIKTVIPVPGIKAYALRCVALHQGLHDMSHSVAAAEVSGFEFVIPRPNTLVHGNQIADTGMLQLQVDIFAEDVCAGVEAWLHANHTDAGIQVRLSEMGKIVTPGEYVTKLNTPRRT